MAVPAGVGLLMMSLCTGSGCAGAQTPLEPTESFHEVRTVIEERTALEVEWPRDDEARELLRAEVTRILAEEAFTADTAVKIALLNNPRLRAQFEEIGVAHAAVVQAGLIGNPRMSFTAKFPDAMPRNPRLELPFLQNIAELYLVPMRRRVAKDMLKQTMLRTSDAVLTLGEDVRVAYFQLAAAHRLLEAEERALDKARTAAEEARLQAEAGRVSELERRRALAAQQGQRLRVALAQIEVEKRREALRELLGVTATELSWREQPRLPPLPDEEPDLAVLEARGLAQRFDVELARQDMELVAHAIGLTRRTLFPTVNLGIAIERDRDRTFLIGPKLALELPVFDQQQGNIQRLKAQARQSRELYEAQVDRALSEIRALRADYVGARRTAEFYRDVVVPLRGDVAAIAQQQHHAIELGVDELLLARDEELAARLGAIQALRDYWIARARLERAAACNLDAVEPAPTPMSWLRWAPLELAGPRAADPGLAIAEPMWPAVGRILSMPEAADDPAEPQAVQH
jgi:outer membrane protein, heavy metal efflux system